MATDSKLQLYSFPTPNGQKIGIALEEMGLPYEAHCINIMKGDQSTPEFKKINPNGKIPALVDPAPADGKGPLSIFESGAILIYLAEKSGKFMPKDLRKQSEVLQWLFFQVGGVGPMLGQMGHFVMYAKEKCDHPYPAERYTTESKRLLSVIDKHLAEGNKQYLAGDEYTIADMATAPWLAAVRRYPKEIIDLSEYPAAEAWVKRVWARPAVQTGIKVCSPEPSA